MKPDIQFFAVSGTWVKPAGAVRVDIVLQGGSGGAIPVLGTKVGAPGELLASSIDAGDLPDTVEVTVGKGGRPGGRDGYALIVTHLTAEQDDPPSAPDPGAPMTGPGGRWHPVSELFERDAENDAAMRRWFEDRGWER